MGGKLKVWALFLIVNTKIYRICFLLINTFYQFAPEFKNDSPPTGTYRGAFCGFKLSKNSRNFYKTLFFFGDIPFFKLLGILLKLKTKLQVKIGASNVPCEPRIRPQKCQNKAHLYPPTLRESGRFDEKETDDKRPDV